MFWLKPYTYSVPWAHRSVFKQLIYLQHFVWPTLLYSLRSPPTAPLGQKCPFVLKLRGRHKAHSVRINSNRRARRELLERGRPETHAPVCVDERDTGPRARDSSLKLHDVGDLDLGVRQDERQVLRSQVKGSPRRSSRDGNGRGCRREVCRRDWESKRDHSPDLGGHQSVGPVSFGPAKRSSVPDRVCVNSRNTDGTGGSDRSVEALQAAWTSRASSTSETSRTSRPFRPRRARTRQSEKANKKCNSKSHCSIETSLVNMIQPEALYRFVQYYLRWLFSLEEQTGSDKRLDGFEWVV